MGPPPAAPISVPGYLAARSDDDTPDLASFPSSTSSPQAASSAIRANSAAKNINVGRSSAEVGIIVGTLIGFGIIAFLLFLLYRRRSDEDVNPLTWWQKRKTAAEPAAVNISDPMATRAVVPGDGSTLQDAYDGTVNESQQCLVPHASDQQTKQSILQKFQQALYGASKTKAKQEPSAGDVEKGQSSDSPEDGISNMENIHASEDKWSSRPVSAADMSIQTRSSMALHPAVARMKSQKKPALRPGISAFSWSTTAPTPVPPSHAGLRENPLPPLPSDRDSRRDTTLTTISEDSQPARHMSVNGWVHNMQTRQEKRAQRLQGNVTDEGEATSLPELLAPPHVANPKARQLTSKDAGSVRLSAMTVDSNAKSPALETATMAWHVHQGPGQVDVSPLPRSTSRGQKEGNQSHDENDQDQYHQGEQYAQQNEYSQEGQYADQNEYSYPAGEHPQESSQQEPEYLQQQSQAPEHEEAPEIHINSPSIATAIPEEDWIPNITRYPSGTTTTTGYDYAAAQSPRI